MIVYTSGRFKGPISNFEIRKNSDPNHASVIAPPPPAQPWWVGKKLTCGICTCVFGVGEGDTVLVSGPVLHLKTPQISVLCPECRLLNRFCPGDTEDADPLESPAQEDP